MSTGLDFLSNLEKFFSHCSNVTQAAKNLPLVISAQTFKNANNFARDEIKKLHESLYIVEKGWYKCSEGGQRAYWTCTPLALYIANFLNDDAIENDDVKNATDKIIESFLGLLTALNRFIRLKNELPAQDYKKEKDIIEESFTELACVLGNIIKPLSDRFKDVVENAIYEGTSLNSLRKQMDKKFGNEPKTIRELLTLDKNTDGSARKKLVDIKALEDKAKSKAQQDRKTQRTRAKLARKANRKK